MTCYWKNSFEVNDCRWRVGCTRHLGTALITGTYSTLGTCFGKFDPAFNALRGSALDNDDKSSRQNNVTSAGCMQPSFLSENGAKQLLDCAEQARADHSKEMPTIQRSCSPERKLESNLFLPTEGARSVEIRGGRSRRSEPPVYSQVKALLVARNYHSDRRVGPEALRS